MESIKGMYNWYLVYMKTIENKNHSNLKCIYTNKEFSDDEQKYISDVFNKTKRCSKYLSEPILKEVKKTLYETVLDSASRVFTDSSDSVYIDTLLQLSSDATYRLITECNKILNDNGIFNVLKSCRTILDSIRKKKYTPISLHALYKSGDIKIISTNSQITSLYFIQNITKIESEYKALKMKEYFITELIERLETNNMLMYYIRANNLWYYAITTVFLPDTPNNDQIVNDFNFISVPQSVFIR